MENIIDKQEEFKQEVMVAAKADITVVDQATYAAANNLIARLQSVRKEVVARFAAPKKKAAEAHKSICALEKEFLNPVDQQISNFKRATERWYLAEQNRIRAEEERKRKEAEEAGRVPTFLEAYDEIEANVKAAESKAAYDAWLERLRAETYIKVY